MAKTLGMDCKLYRSASLLTGAEGGEPADLVWVEIDDVRDVTQNLDTGEADVTTRGSGGWRATQATLKDGSVDFELLAESGDASFEAIRDAWLNNTELAMAVMDGDIDSAGSQGLAANMSVTSFTRSEPLEEAMSYAVTVKPSSQAEWYEVAGS